MPTVPPGVSFSKQNEKRHFRLPATTERIGSVQRRPYRRLPAGLPGAARETRSYTTNPCRSAELRRQNPRRAMGEQRPQRRASVRPPEQPCGTAAQHRTAPHRVTAAPQPRQALPPPPAARFSAPYHAAALSRRRYAEGRRAQLAPGPTGRTEPGRAVTRVFCRGRAGCRSPGSALRGEGRHKPGLSPPPLSPAGPDPAAGRALGRPRPALQEAAVGPSGAAGAGQAGGGAGRAGRPSAPGEAAGSAECQAAGTASARSSDAIISRREREEFGSSDGGLQGLPAAQGGTRGGRGGRAAGRGGQVSPGDAARGGGRPGVALLRASPALCLPCSVSCVPSSAEGSCARATQPGRCRVCFCFNG